MTESKFAERIFLKSGNRVYKYKGVYAEIKFGDSPEKVIDGIIKTGLNKFKTVNGQIPFIKSI